MPLFDQEKIVKLTSELRKSVQRLSALGKLSEEEFTGDPDKIGSAKYHLIVGIEICIDICTHLISRNGYRVPEDYGDTFMVMSEVGALDSAFSEELKKMAKFRNRLVHLYFSGGGLRRMERRKPDSLLHSPIFSIRLIRVIRAK